MTEINPFPGQRLARSPYLEKNGPRDYSENDIIFLDPDEEQKANLVTSVPQGMGIGHEMHRVVLDVDHDVRVVPSSTPGHHHLFIDVRMSFRQYALLLDVLANVGIVEPGYASASKQRGCTAVRLPHVRKPAAA